MIFLNVANHKKICNSRLQQQQHTKSSLSTNSEKLRELAEIELHFGIASTSTSASQPQLVHHTGSNVHHSMGKSLLSTSSNNSSPLLIPSNNNSPTSMMTAVATGGGNGQSTNHLVGDINIINRHLNHGNRASPLIDPHSSFNAASIYK
ncbi:zinc finger domain-containing protein [Dermatophagoides farinae]|uniref:Zinc finger domain-containing protein n=1 Tax=Dermatophagoides farinae TaxID=6954 RepID=A0A9D4NUR9_DERFA|nr:zinc finger domain-containing protein [Dermatophagoides farinae]